MSAKTNPIGVVISAAGLLLVLAAVTCRLLEVDLPDGLALLGGSVAVLGLAVQQYLAARALHRQATDDAARWRGSDPHSL